MKQTLSPADRRALELPIGVAADEAATDAWLARETGTAGAPLADRARLDDTLGDRQRLILLAKIGARDSAAESHRFATVKGLDDQLAAVTATIATRPAFYRPGTFAALAEAYADAGAPEQANETRRLALLEPYFRTFAQAGTAAQQRHLDDLTGPERTMTETILRHQQDAFARDAYAAGTALYPDVGPPLPEEDTEGRLRQARMIGSLRGMPLPPLLRDDEPPPLQTVQYRPAYEKPTESTVPEVFRPQPSFRDRVQPRPEWINSSPMVRGLARTFDPNSPNHHRYAFSDVLCDTKTPGCTVEAAYASLQRHSVPGGPKPGVPIENDEQSPVPLLFIPGGHVRTYVEPENRSIVNVTEPDHRYTHGIVLRQVAIEGDKIVVRTYGEGNNLTSALATENAILGRAAFVLATQRMRSELKPPPENGRWDDRRAGAQDAQGLN